MPFFEYKCLDCNAKYEIYHRSAEKKEEIVCSKCGSVRYTKLISVFSSKVYGNASKFYDDCAISGNCSPEKASSCGCSGGCVH